MLPAWLREKQAGRKTGFGWLSFCSMRSGVLWELRVLSYQAWCGLQCPLVIDCTDQRHSDRSTRRIPFVVQGD